MLPQVCACGILRKGSPLLLEPKEASFPAEGVSFLGFFSERKPPSWILLEAPFLALLWTIRPAPCVETATGALGRTWTCSSCRELSRKRGFAQSDTRGLHTWSWMRSSRIVTAEPAVRFSNGQRNPARTSLHRLAGKTKQGFSICPGELRVATRRHAGLRGEANAKRHSQRRSHSRRRRPVHAVRKRGARADPTPPLESYKDPRRGRRAGPRSPSRLLLVLYIGVGIDFLLDRTCLPARRIRQPRGRDPHLKSPRGDVIRLESFALAVRSGSDPLVKGLRWDVIRL